MNMEIMWYAGNVPISLFFFTGCKLSKELPGILNHFNELNNTKVENSMIQAEHQGPIMFQDQHISRWQKIEKNDTYTRHKFSRQARID